MHWLNSYFPEDCTGYGCERGTCAANTGVPAEIEVSAASASVTYSNIRVGPIGSTYSGSSTTTTTTTTTTSGSTSRSSSSSTTSTTTTTASGATQTHWGQCGGQDYSGPTVCASPWTCTYSNPWYSQCL
ncbi:hypothetical protein FS837_011035 [Tulasnella sp. UAMH 9824]|nr:hypothetical protein FS837_011035 [Tulasnella sp. UAMH 9824]